WCRSPFQDFGRASSRVRATSLRAIAIEFCWLTLLPTLRAFVDRDLWIAESSNPSDLVKLGKPARVVWRSAVALCHVTVALDRPYDDEAYAVLVQNGARQVRSRRIIDRFHVRFALADLVRNCRI